MQKPWSRNKFEWSVVGFVAGVLLLWGGLILTLVYVAVHFINKFW